MHAKSFSIDILNQSKVLIRRIRYHPGHRFDRIEGSLGFYGVNNLSYRINNQCIGILGIILSIEAIPDFASASGNVYTAVCAQLICQFQLILAILHCRFSLIKINGDNIFPDTDFSDDQIMLPGTFQVSLLLFLTCSKINRRQNCPISQFTDEPVPLFRIMIRSLDCSTDSHSYLSFTSIIFVSITNFYDRLLTCQYV